MIEQRIAIGSVVAALQARKIAAYQNSVRPGTGCRWAALPAHVRTGDCERRWSPTWRYSAKSMLSPLDAGYLHRVVERVRLREGLSAVKKTWGKGYRVMQAESAQAVIR